MSTRKPWLTARRVSGLGGALCSLCLAGGVLACSSLLDVKNPNNVAASDLDNPTTAPAIANGALSSVAYGWGAILTEYATASDELTWIGSRDGFRELDIGNLTNPTNEFTDAAFPFVGRARWMADLAIARLSGFNAAGTLKNRDDLARSYLYAAIAYTMIGDMFNNFPIGSDQRTAAPPLGRANMDSTYKVAIAYATKGLAVAAATGNTSYQTALTAIRARAAFAKAVWARLHPTGPSIPIGGAPALVDDPMVNADANAALGLAGAGDWKWRFSYSATTVDNYIGAWVPARQEMRIGDRFVNKAAKDTLRDPVSGVVDPEIRRAVLEFIGNSSTQLYGPLTVSSSRDLHLMLAEAALAAGDTVGPTSAFATHVNVRRSLDKLPLYDPSNPTHPRPLAMLKYERMVNTFLQGHRVHDLYRYGERADMWQTTVPVAEAITAPGTLFPITQIELLSNPYCVQSPVACQ